MMKLVMPRSSYVPRRNTTGIAKIIPTGAPEGLEVYMYQGGPNGDTFYAVGWGAGKSQKPKFNFRYKSLTDRDKHLAKFFAEEMQYAETRAEWKTEAKVKRSSAHTLKLGDLLRSSWGYDQTNVDYYQVTRVVSDHSVEITPIGQDKETTGYDTGNCTPVKDSFTGKPMTKRANSSNSVKIESYAHAYLWDGKPDRWSSYA